MSPDSLALIRRHLEAENAHDLDGTPATLNPECRFDGVATGQCWVGHEGATAHYRQWRTISIRRQPLQSPCFSTW